MSKVEELFSLKDKVSLITGGGRGIGRAVAIGYAEAGSDIVITSRTKGDLDEVADIISKLGRRVITIQADVSKTETLPDLVRTTVAELGSIDVLVNNVGAVVIDPIEKVKFADFDYMVNANLKSLITLAQEAIPHMKKQGAGKIINVTSTAAVRVDVGSGVYSMTKSGVKMLTRTLAVELAREGANIQVNCIGPGAHATSQWKRVVSAHPELEEVLIKQIPTGRIAEPEEIVGTFIYLASAASNNVTGQSLYPDGGWLNT